MDASVETQPILETARLTLRPLRKSDAGLISLYTSDLRVARMTSSIPHPNPPGAVEQFIERMQASDSNEMTWTIDGTRGFGCEVMGVIGLHRDGEFGYWVAPFFWGMGLATEAASAVMDHGFAQGRARIHAAHFEDNPASGRVMQKLGMTLVGPDKEPVFSVARGEAVRHIRYERLRDE